MTNERTINVNKKIVKFMGLKSNFEGYEDLLEDLKYHEKWSWIMPVWMRIMEWGKSEFGIKWRQEITESQIWIQAGAHKIFVWPITSKRIVDIKDIWLAVEVFMDWYDKDQLEQEQKLIG